FQMLSAVNGHLRGSREAGGLPPRMTQVWFELPVQSQSSASAPLLTAPGPPVISRQRPLPVLTNLYSPGVALPAGMLQSCAGSANEQSICWMGVVLAVPPTGWMQRP